MISLKLTFVVSIYSFSLLFCSTRLGFNEKNNFADGVRNGPSVNLGTKFHVETKSFSGLRFTRLNKG